MANSLYNSFNIFSGIFYQMGGGGLEIFLEKCLQESHFSWYLQILNINSLDM